MKKIVSIVVAIALVAFLIYTITYHKKVIPVEEPGKVSATGAYEKYFGAAPTVDKGTAYAFVIYFPSSKEPGKVVPFPFFTFDEESIKKVAIERLLGGMDAGSYSGEFISLPTGTRLLGIDHDQETVTVNFSQELGKSAEAGAARAIALTLRQFKDVKSVRLQVDGKETPLSVIAKKADDTAIEQPSPPRLLSVS